MPSCHTTAASGSPNVASATIAADTASTLWYDQRCNYRHCVIRCACHFGPINLQLPTARATCGLPLTNYWDVDTVLVMAFLPMIYPLFYRKSGENPVDHVWFSISNFPSCTTRRCVYPVCMTFIRWRRSCHLLPDKSYAVDHSMFMF